ncbi:polysaccharide pyruvyl transferase family protein [Luteipulveratus sp. YIM 133132]|uniref:polysaccharide pyruvyl transferase family protein n=1 Tax=Luteipulveratus flavus TaxID=3031728 RepID=UPI0023B157B5|nr:polysaccharide pyruvyl transferase family protein [Luteipulveratus sp. YIM 133132]MDE9364312.1 polysaccharide pyruvyl transferase family protein [Luteipulveratus sp. YIM 133132]
MGEPATLRCRACGSERPRVVVDLGEVPASDLFPRADDPAPDPRWPLTLAMCPDCCLVQLGAVRGAMPEPQSAVDSDTALAHAAASVERVVADERLAPGHSVLELDSSHGASWLPRFVERGLRPVDEGPADLVVDVHYLMHEEHLDAVVAAHAARLAPGGVLVCEFFHVLPLVEGGLVDTIRHGHFVYLSGIALQPLLERHGLVLTRAEMVPVYGGSVRISARRAADDPSVDPSVDELLRRERSAGLDRVDTLDGLGELGRKATNALRERLVELRSRGSRVAAYGAPSKAAVLLALADVDDSLLPYTVDKSPAKHGHRVPGARVPIMAPEQLLQDRPDEVVVLTWDIAEEVIAQLREMARGSGWQPTFYVPLPQPRELTFATAPAGGRDFAEREPRPPRSLRRPEPRVESGNRTSAGPIVVFGELGGPNLGNEASFESLLALIHRDIPDAAVHVLCYVPERMTARHDVTADHINWPRHERTPRPLRPVEKVALRVGDLARTARQVRSARAVLIPGAGVFEGELGTRMLGLPLSFWRLAVSCRMYRVPLLVIGAGASPVQEPWSRRLFAGGLRRVTHASFRDERSRDIVRGWTGRPDQGAVSGDLALLLEYEQGSAAASVPDPELVVVGVMRNGGRRTTGHDYEERVTELVRGLVARGRRVRLVGGDSADDETMDLIVRRCGDERVDSVRATSLRELAEAISPAAAVIGTRYHNLVIALQLGKPTVSLGYARKCQDLMAIFGVPGLSFEASSFAATDVLAALDDALEHGTRPDSGVLPRLRDAMEADWATCRNLIEGAH